MIKAFPKIFAVGSTYIPQLFDNEVEISEKIDGSQLNFGKIDGELFIRSKGKQIFIESPDKMFQKGIDYILSIQEKIEDNAVYYCEYLQNPHHNLLEYERVPKNNLILFGVSTSIDSFVKDYNTLQLWADKLDIEVVPLLYHGKIDNPEQLLAFLVEDSVLGGTKIEGVVIKNYSQPFLLGGQPIPLMMGKYVREDFKEVAREKWGKEHTSKGKWETFKESFKTEARWEKGIQHLKEKGELENSPRDIGKLIAEIKQDIVTEEQDDIKDFLFREFGDELLRYATSKFPEFYKEKLLKDSFKENK